MPTSNFSFGVTSWGIPALGSIPAILPGRYIWVNPLGTNTGESPEGGFRLISDAILDADAGDAILIAPGGYDPAAVLTIPRTKSKLTLVGLGGRGAAYIEPSTEDQSGLIVLADDVTLVNLGVAGEDETSAVALTVFGSRFRAYGCKFEGGLTQLQIGPGSIAQQNAGTHGNGADALFDDCEFCWGTNGVVLRATDYGGVTQARFRNCRYHDLTAASFEETNVGGSASVQYFGLVVDGCVFETAEDGTVPTKWMSLNDDNANTGIVTGCHFPTAINSGKNLVSTKLLWVSNYMTGGVSTGQPS